MSNSSLYFEKYDINGSLTLSGFDPSKCAYWFNHHYNKICISLDSIEKIEISNNHLIILEKKNEN